MNVITTAIFFFFAAAKDIVLYSKDSLKNADKGFSGFVKLLPGATVILSVVVAISNIANFFITTGYGPQIESIREGGLDGGVIETTSPGVPFFFLLMLFAILEIIGTAKEKDKNGKDEGSRLLKNSALSWLYYFILIPLLTYAVVNAPALGFKLILIIAAILFAGFLFGIIGFGGTGSPAPSEGKSDIDRKIEKKAERAAYLRKQAADYKHYNKRQAEGAWGYQDMNARLNREKIRDLEKEAAFLDKDIEKLNKKKEKKR